MDTSPALFDSIWHPRLLAGLLRSSRLTLLFGAAGSGKTSLLKAGLLPLLCRRAGDLAAALGNVPGASPHERERRVRADGAGAGAARVAEIVIVVNDWAGAPPLVLLQRRLALAVPASAAARIAAAPTLDEALAIANRMLGARLLIVLDRFEDVLLAPPESEGLEPFMQALIDAINAPALAANFLLSLRDDAEPQLDRYAGQVIGFGQHYLRLPPPRARGGLEGATTATSSDDASGGASDSASDVVPDSASDSAPGVASTPEPSPQPLCAADVYHEIEARLARVNREAIAPAWAPPHESATVPPGLPPVPQREPRPAPAVHGPSTPSRVTARATATVRASMPADPRRPDPPPLAESAAASAYANPRRDSRAALRRRPAPARWIALGASAAGLVMAAMWWAPVPPSAVSPGLAPPSAAPTQARVSTPPAGFADQLTALVGPAALAPPEFAVEGGWAEALAFAPGAPALAITRYDALQAARIQRATPPLQIVAPLALDELVFVAHAASAMRYLHEMRGHPIDAGGPTSARALTLATLHTQMFGEPAVPMSAAAVSEATTLLRLADGSAQGGDPVALVSAAALDRFAAQRPGASAQLRVLALDPQNTASRRALRGYLPATLRAADHRAWLARDVPTLAVMAFLVTSAATEANEPTQIEHAARRLCERLPVLRRTGDAKWQEVDPGVRLPTGWPESATAMRVFAACPAATASGQASALADATRIDPPTNPPQGARP